MLSVIQAWTHNLIIPDTWEEEQGNPCWSLFYAELRRFDLIKKSRQKYWEHILGRRELEVPGPRFIPQHCKKCCLCCSLLTKLIVRIWRRDIGKLLSMPHFLYENSVPIMWLFSLTVTFFLFSMVYPGFKLPGESVVPTWHNRNNSYNPWRNNVYSINSNTHETIGSYSDPSNQIRNFLPDPITYHCYCFTGSSWQSLF
jgi:hypothetical protein